MKTKRSTSRPMLLAATLAMTSACTNVSTPEGYEGYLFHVPLVVGEASYVDSQVGPTSTGMVWRQFVVNVDVRPKNYTEQFHILSRDNLNVGFQAHARIAIRQGAVRELVETFGATGVNGGTGENPALPSWYVRAVQQPYRTAIRDVVHTYDAYDIQAETQQIGARVLELLREQYADTPIEFLGMSIGNLTYPDAINAEIQRKLAAEQDLERMARRAADRGARGRDSGHSGAGARRRSADCQRHPHAPLRAA